MNNVIIKNATLVTPTEVLEGASVSIKNGKIDQIFTGSVELEGESIIDIDDAFLMAGIIDIHTDALDAEIIPRPGADIPINVAFRELERKMSGCGFTTVYHSLHLGYRNAEYHSRSKYSRNEVFETVYNATQGSTLLNNKIHLRFELTGVHAYNDCIEFMRNGYISMLSVMDHTPGQGQFTRSHFIELMIKNGKTREQAEQEYEEKINRTAVKGEELEFMIKTATDLGIPVASHDDDTTEKVDYMKSVGVNICEFPINLETAKHATNLGMYVVGGASNILRGGSLSGNVNMKDAVLSGFVDSLCSDYYPPSILHSIFKLHHEGNMSLPDAVNLATLNPAKAAGISAVTGSIETGKNADLIVVKLIDGIPMVTHTIVNGHLAAQASSSINYNQSEQN
ncbi:MAG: alpha-D-ribose 1-methylphosphonate 5-triphosphate diphosphatase [Chitinophagaceae bacterium]|nr:alpha-D-ribose 1-methylphosphonate 5-triphosphate diphosphatase [Chitinophagaceae bacterium]